METQTFYLTQPEEVAKFQELRRRKGFSPGETAWIDVCRALAGADEQVFNAMWSFWNFAHAFDDLLDESRWNAEQIEAAMTGLHDAVAYVLTRQGEGYDIEALLAVLNAPPLAKTAWLDFVQQLHDNPFIRRHRYELRGMFVQCMTRCLDGDAMAQSDDPQRRAVAPAVRCGDIDVLLHMVYLSRGWAALRAAQNFREYDLPDTLAGDANDTETRKEVV